MSPPVLPSLQAPPAFFDAEASGRRPAVPAVDALGQEWDASFHDDAGSARKALERAAGARNDMSVG